jgi:hypothetical protein
MTLNPLDLITLESFLVALAQLDSIPIEVKRELENLGHISSANVGALNSIAEKNSQLMILYREARQVIGDDNERSKGKPPIIDHQSQRDNQELINLLDEISTSPNPKCTLIDKTSSDSSVLSRLLHLVRQPRT